jgi:hypothetical protein
MGDCRRECATVARVCRDTLGEHDTEVSELCVRRASAQDIEDALCKELSGACARPPPPYEGARPEGEEWVEVDEGQVKVQRMLAQMEGDGMSGNVRPPLSWKVCSNPARNLCRDLLSGPRAWQWPARRSASTRNGQRRPSQ